MPRTPNPEPRAALKMARIKKGDTVTVLSGKDQGKTGKVLRVWPERDRALVERINLLSHFERKSQQAPSGGVVLREAALPLSKLTLACPRCRRPARIGWRVSSDGAKQRMCRRCKDTL